MTSGWVLTNLICIPFHSYFPGILTTSIGAALVWKTNPPAFAAQATRPLLRCLVSVLRIQQLSTELSNQLENSGEQVIEVNSGVKYMIKDLDMRLNVEEGTLYLVDGKREEARRHGQEALEYLSQIVEVWECFDWKQGRQPVPCTSSSVEIQTANPD